MINDLRERILNIILNYPQYKLVGAYAITKNLEDKDWEARFTTDLDIRICCDLYKTKDIDHLIKILNDNNLKTVVKITKNNNFKIFVKDENNSQIKIDIEFKTGQNIKTNIKNLDESLRDKIELVMMIPDREFKNVVDSIICIHTNYPEGISKDKLLQITKDIDLHNINLETHLHLANKFKPKILNDLTMEEYAICFDNLMQGLLSDHISNNSIFKDGKWYN